MIEGLGVTLSTTTTTTTTTATTTTTTSTLRVDHVYLAPQRDPTEFTYKQTLSNFPPWDVKKIIQNCSKMDRKSLQATQKTPTPGLPLPPTSFFFVAKFHLKVHS